MTWTDVTRPPKPKVVRQFGVVCFLIFGGFGLFQALVRARTGLGWGSLGFGGLCLVLGLGAPGLFRWFYTGAMLLAFPIGFAVSQVMLAFLFFVVFLAVGLFLRLRGWDAMVRKRRTGTGSRSYWEPKPAPTDPQRYLRQY